MALHADDIIANTPGHVAAHNTLPVLVESGADIQGVIDDADPGARLLCSAVGDYTFTALEVDRGILIDLNGATLTKVGTTGHAVTTTDEWSGIRNGILDLDAQTSGNGVELGADNCLAENLRILNAAGYGIHGDQVNNPHVLGNTIIDSGNEAIFIENQDAFSTGVIVERNIVDRSSLGAGITGGGIKVRGETDAPIYRCRVTDNEVTLPESPSDDDPICIEVWYAHNAVVTGNQTRYGSMGLSLAGCPDTIPKDNTVFGPSLYGIESAGSGIMSITGNTIDGAGITAHGISGSVSAFAGDPDSVTITANTIRGCTNSSIHWVDAENISITGNTLHALAGAYLINLQGCTDFTITGNTIDGNDLAHKGIILDNTKYGAINGNNFRRCTQNCVLLFSDDNGFVFDEITLNGNRFSSSTGARFTHSLSNGAALGNFIRAVGNTGLGVIGNDDILDYKNDVRDMVGTGTPEGVISAGVGSTFRRRNGGAATTLYVKESGTGNTGWVAK